jgi:hypothetical protein
MTPSDLNRIEGAYAEAAIDFGVRNRALTVAETFRNPARLTSSDALLGANAAGSLATARRWTGVRDVVGMSIHRTKETRS